MLESEGTPMRLRAAASWHTSSGGAFASGTNKTAMAVAAEKNSNGAL